MVRFCEDTSLFQKAEWKTLEQFASASLQLAGHRTVIEMSGKIWLYGGQHHASAQLTG